MNDLVIWVMYYRMIVYVYWNVYKNGLLNWFGVLEYDNVDCMNMLVEEWSITVLEWGGPLGVQIIQRLFSLLFL